MKNRTSAHLEGALKLLSDALHIMPEEELIIVGAENLSNMTRHVHSAAARYGLKDVLSVVTPSELRPMRSIPGPLARAIPKTYGLIHLIERSPEEDFAFNRPLRSLCKEEGCKYLFMIDPRPNYLVEGICADYQEVERTCLAITEILTESVKITVTSSSGTDLSFALYDTVVPRSPMFHEHDARVQSPEGEVTACPIERTFEGLMVVDGPVTNLGTLEQPMMWEFCEGQARDVRGSEYDISRLVAGLQASDERLSSLQGIWIAEFAMGTNDWAVLDDNISNCEKVSGTIHFGMGKTVRNIGEDRGERYHFDSIITDATVRAVKQTGEEIIIVDSGRLVL